MRADTAGALAALVVVTLMVSLSRPVQPVSVLTEPVAAAPRPAAWGAPTPAPIGAADVRVTPAAPAPFQPAPAPVQAPAPLPAAPAPAARVLRGQELGSEAAFAQQQAADGAVVVVFANYGYRETLVNWLVAVTRTDIHNFCIFALDAELQEFLVARDVPSFLRVPRETHSSFHTVVNSRMEVMEPLLRSGLAVLLSDVDVVFLDNPLPYLREQDADVLSQRGKWPPKQNDKWGATLCVGLLYLRGRAADVMPTVLRESATTPDDQMGFNRALDALGVRWDAGRMQLKSAGVERGATAAGVTVGLLPLDRFQRWCSPNTDGVFVKHCQSPKNGASKIKSLKAEGLYFIGEGWEVVGGGVTPVGSTGVGRQNTSLPANGAPYNPHDDRSRRGTFFSIAFCTTSSAAPLRCFLYPPTSPERTCSREYSALPPAASTNLVLPALPYLLSRTWSCVFPCCISCACMASTVVASSTCCTLCGDSRSPQKPASRSTSRALSLTRSS